MATMRALLFSSTRVQLAAANMPSMRFSTTFDFARFELLGFLELSLVFGRRLDRVGVDALVTLHDELAKILQRGDKDGAVMSSYQAASSTCFRFFQPSRNKDASVNLFSKLCT